ncbi:hypothetical protein CLV30_102169 [Haloactinopolyspora alba]|uniref:Uncharacterized protein n=1 Tax=Haloactinopolyspora alba TaxID=648780 RepID=A0A2P8EBD1_9ACTN|nr:hypothetical protein [Haloactinopolyspora alba]PSL06781.1 hypothetical protein CLV30_102169 [Haloactinopolyspora alba]
MGTNADREALEQLKTDVSKDVPDISDRFKGIAERMGNGSVWYGTQADNFSTDLDGEKGTLSTSTNELTGDIEDQLANVPESDGGN